MRAKIHIDMRNPSISIITPVYNVEPYLRRCLDSILKQSNPDWEALIIDDGSTDMSGEICDEYATRDNRFKVFHQANSGVSSARNVGLDHAKGDWIWFVDADDEIVDNSLSYLKYFISNYKCDTVFSGLINVYDDRNEIIDSVSILTNISKDEFLLRKYAYQNGMLLFYRDIVEQHSIRFDETIKIGEDLQFQYKYLAYCKIPISCGRSLYKYYHRQGSAMINDNAAKQRLEDSISILKSFLKENLDPYLTDKRWLSDRLIKLLKAALTTASLSKSKDRQLFDNQFKRIFRELKESVYSTAIDNSLEFAYRFPKLYYFLKKHYLKYKSVHINSMRPSSE